MDELDNILEKFDALYKDSLTSAKKKEENIIKVFYRLKELILLLSDQQDKHLSDEEIDASYKKSLSNLALLEDFLCFYIEESETNQHLIYTLLSVLKLSSNDKAYKRIKRYMSKYEKKVSKKEDAFIKKWDNIEIEKFKYSPLKTFN
jgi:hypothetical protein